MQKVNKHLMQFVVLSVIIVLGFIYIYFTSFRPYQFSQIKKMQHMGQYVNEIGQSLIINHHLIQMQDSTYQKLHARQKGYFSLDDEKVYQLKNK